jgi:uncharacterized Zn finger protein
MNEKDEGLPDLKPSDIQDWVGATSFQRGQNYFHQGAIREPRRQGMTLKARCLGSSAPSYRVQVALDSEGIAEADCSCPVGAGGRCKHVAALLLTWLDAPETFHEIEDLTPSLKQRSKDELISLIRRMLGRYPDLEYLLEMPLPSSGSPQAAVDPEVIRRQAEQAFGDLEDEWGWRDTFETTRDLEELLVIAAEYLQAGAADNAGTIYQMAAETILDHEDLVMNDEAGRLAGLVDECIEGIGTCLQAVEDPNRRQHLFRSIFEVYLWDLKVGGVGIGDGVPEILLEETNPAERAAICDWVQAALPGTREWGQEILGGLLLELQADALDDEAFLDICRRTGRLNDLVDRLLALGRVDEAAIEARRAGDYYLLALGDNFVEHGQGDLAEELIRERATSSQDARLTAWLKGYALKRGRLQEAQDLAERLFWLQPALTEYVELKKLATARRGWTELRAEVLAKLDQSRQHHLLVEIYLDEREIDLALKALEEARKSAKYRWDYPYGLELEVAKAAEAGHPREAIRLYMRAVEQLIDQRGRENYVEAAVFLKTVRALYERLGEQEVWQELISGLKERNRTLRALKDELHKAGL